MRIVFCINYFLPYQVAGTEVYTFELAKYLQTKGYTVAVVFPDRNNNLPRFYELEGLAVHTYPETDVNDKTLMRGERPPSGLLDFSKLMQDLQPDIVHFQELEAGTSIGLYHIKEVSRLGFKSVFTFHLSHYSCYTGTMVQSLEKRCSGKISPSVCSYCAFRTRGLSSLSSGILTAGGTILKFAGFNTGSYKSPLATALGMPFLIEQKTRNLETVTALVSKLVVITDWYKEVLRLNHVPDEKIRVIKQGLPHATVSSALPEEEIADRPFRLIFIGRISKFKGVHLLLEALRGIDEDQIQLDIYGPTNEEDYAEKLVQESAIRKNISWKGILQKEEVIGVLKTYHALCLPSTFSEMSPLVIQEAFAAGIPVIGSDVYGNAEQIEPGVNGLLFRFNDAASLQEQLMRCITDPNLLKDMRKRVAAPRMFREVGDAYDELYREFYDTAISTILLKTQ